MSNTFGRLFTFTSFGESHGSAVGGIVDGCPPSLEIDEAFIQSELERRRPGQSDITTPRKESDKVEFLSGIFRGKTTGSPIAFLIRNTDQHEADYHPLKDVYRPSHADFTYRQKYGIRDHRGGGRSSARETAARVVAGAIAKLALRKTGICVMAYTSQVGHISMNLSHEAINPKDIEGNAVRCPQPDVAAQMLAYIRQIKAEGDSIGGIISCVIKHLPGGWGEPVFDKLSARLAQAMFSIQAVHGFDYGQGFDGVGMKGSQMNDAFVVREGKVTTLTNHSGGIQGGISNGQDIFFRVLFKPTPTISKRQFTVDLHGRECIVEAKGRHDPCVLPRAVAVVEAMTAMVLMDFYLLQQKVSPSCLTRS